MSTVIKGKRIAVVGASNDPQKYGNAVYRDMLNAGYDVFGVNPKGGELLGRKVYRSLSEFERAPDLVVTVVQPTVTEKVVEECHRLGVREIWMQPGSESEQAVVKAKQYGMDVTYNSCIMVSNGIW